jgi:hypothetical protein
MTLDLDKLEALMREATAGPWEAGRSDMTSYDVNTGQPFTNVYGPDDDPRAHRHHVTGDMLPPVIARAEGNTCNEDAPLIAAAVNALPELIAIARKWQLARQFLDALAEEGIIT